MKIAFWSERGKVGTTFNLTSIACAAALAYPISVAVVTTGYRDSCLEESFVRKKHRRAQDGCARELMVAETQEYYVSRGLECLLRKGMDEDLTKEDILANMHQVVPGRLYCMAGSRRREQEWWYADSQFVRLGRLMDAMDSCFDVVFLDCGDRRDDFSKKMREEADVSVLNMSQEEELIGEYYRVCPIRREKMFFLVGNYFRDGLYTRENLERIYRISPDCLGAIPYHPRLAEAGRSGRLDGAVRKYVKEGDCAGFWKELWRTASLLLRKAGAVR